jgi:hypothetical protein
MDRLLALPLDIKREIAEYNLSSYAYYYIYDEEFRNSADIGLVAVLLEWHIDNECVSAPLMKELVVKLYELKITFIRLLFGVYVVRTENYTIGVCDDFVEYRNDLIGFIARAYGKLPAKVYMNGDQYFYKGEKLVRKRVNGRYIACV